MTTQHHIDTTGFTIRIASARLKCSCASPIEGYRAELMRDGHAAQVCLELLPTRGDAEVWAQPALASGEFTAHRAVPVPNLDYRRDCQGFIGPGERYIDAGQDTRRPYCLRCGIAVAATASAA